MRIGSAAGLDRTNVDEVRAFFKTYYRPNNATMAVVGDVTTASVYERAEKWFGPIVVRVVPRRARPGPVVLSRETRLDVATGANCQRWYIGWPTPPAYKEDSEELDVLATTLAGGPASRPRRRLVRELQVAKSIDAWNDSNLRGGMFTIEAVAQPGHTGEELVRAIDAEPRAWQPICNRPRSNAGRRTP